MAPKICESHFPGRHALNDNADGALFLRIECNCTRPLGPPSFARKHPSLEHHYGNTCTCPMTCNVWAASFHNCLLLLNLHAATEANPFTLALRSEMWADCPHFRLRRRSSTLAQAYISMTGYYTASVVAGDPLSLLAARRTIPCVECFGGSACDDRGQNHKGCVVTASHTRCICCASHPWTRR